MKIKSNKKFPLYMYSTIRALTVLYKIKSERKFKIRNIKSPSLWYSHIQCKCTPTATHTLHILEIMNMASRDTRAE